MHPKGQYLRFQTQADHSQAMLQMQPASSQMKQMFREYSAIHQSMQSQVSIEFLNPLQM